MDSTGSAERPVADADLNEARRLRNVRNGYGCPHGRLYPETEMCRPCAEYEASIMDPALD